MEKILAFFVAVIIFIIWAAIRSSRIQKDQLQKLKIVLGSIDKLLTSDTSEIYLNDITYNAARGTMEWLSQIQHSGMYEKPDGNTEIGALIEKFKTKSNPYRPIKNSESFLLQINYVDYLIILSTDREPAVQPSVLLGIERVTSSTLLRDAHPVNDYTQDWDNISATYRKKQRYICQNCGVDLSSERRLLHVHHKNRDKGDNREKNLIALCASCHKMQPYHEQRLDVPHSDLKKISLLRTQQGVQE